MRLVDWVAIVGAILMIPYGIAIIIRPQIHGSRLTFIRWLGGYMVLVGLFMLANHLHLI